MFSGRIGTITGAAGRRILRGFVIPSIVKYAAVYAAMVIKTPLWINSIVVSAVVDTGRESAYYLTTCEFK